MANPPLREPRLKLAFRHHDPDSRPPPGTTRRAVAEGESFGTIADEYRMHWSDLVLLNFETLEPAEINWYLKNYVGCTRVSADGSWYVFDGSCNRLLVPDTRASDATGSAARIRVTRAGKAKRDTRARLILLERTRARTYLTEIAGKWIYVFSGPKQAYQQNASIYRKELEDFYAASAVYEVPGSDANPEMAGAPGGDPEPPGLPESQGDEKPGTAFEPHFLSRLHRFDGRPDRIEFEVWAAPRADASNATVQDVAGNASNDVGKFRAGKWYVCRDRDDLDRATQAQRESRTSYVEQDPNSLRIELPEEGVRELYFLISPVKLGPEALRYAMDHPEGLTPLLKSGAAKEDWENSAQKDAADYQWLFPGRTALDTTELVVGVIDPYAWAEDLAEEVLPDSLSRYQEWLRSRRESVLERLREDTGWSAEEARLAILLEQIRESYESPSGIDAGIADPIAWRSGCERWKTELIERNAELSAAAHKDALELITWLESPGHRIVEFAVLRDTTMSSSLDALDMARAITHWAVVSEILIAMEPGIAYLRYYFNLSTGRVGGGRTAQPIRPASVVRGLVLDHFPDLSDPGRIEVRIEQENLQALRYAFPAAMLLVGLYDVIREDLPSGGTRLRRAARERSRTIAQIANQLELSKAEVVVGPDPSQQQYSGTSAAGSTSKAVTDTMGTFLGLADLHSNWMIDGKILEQLDSKTHLSQLGAYSAWWEDRPRFASLTKRGVTWSKNTFSWGMAAFNLYSTCAQARSDLQGSVTPDGWIGMLSGTYTTLYEMVSLVGARVGAHAAFPLFEANMASLSGLGRIFGGMNVVAMIGAGVATCWSMAIGWRKAKNWGDYTAAVFYGVGFVGGVGMIAGGVVVGYALMAGGAASSWTGVGLVVFAVGGIIAGVSGVLAWVFSSDDFEVYAEHCFLGTRGGNEPRFGDDPPKWSMAKKEGPNSWPTPRQHGALMNLIGRFKMKTGVQNKDVTDGYVNIDMTPGFLPGGSEIEVALYYEDSAAGTRLTFKPPFAEPTSKQSMRKAQQVGKPLADPDKAFATYYDASSGGWERIRFTFAEVEYDRDRESSLVAKVRLEPKGSTGAIEARDYVVNTSFLDSVEDDEETAEIFEYVGS